RWWDESRVFECDAKDQAPKAGEKFCGSFPVPYMNGFLHLGHAYSLSKIEFASSFECIRGANLLLPFGFHCTGMPIKASADWKRSFITTDINPFFDKFVRWQMRKLKEYKKIVKAFRYTIYSPLDGQPCADHYAASEHCGRYAESESEATLGGSLRSLDVEIGSADGLDDSADRQGSVDSRTRRTNVSLGNAASVSGIEVFFPINLDNKHWVAAS
nr:leucine--tRNA ligase, cytoplasmic [Tanacetum cinerariifolium]